MSSSLLKSSCRPQDYYVRCYCVDPGENPLHVAVKLGHQQLVTDIIREQPGLALQLNQDGFSPLHLACWSGHLEIVATLIQENLQLCLKKDRYGRTPLHTASIKGRLGVIKQLLGACPECVLEVTAVGETPLHVAVSHNQIKAVRLLVDCLKGRDCFEEIVNRSDCSGNTALHLATSRKQLQTMKILLSGISNKHIVDVNATNHGGFTALDILDVLPQRGKIDMEIEKVLRRAGALPAIEKMKAHSYNHDVSIEFGSKCLQPSSLRTITEPLKTKNEFSSDASYALLLMATLLATITFQAALNPPGSEEGYEFESSINGISQIGKPRSYLSHLFILFNSIVFFTSIALIIIITREFPLKPGLLITVFSLIGAYLCKVKAVSPRVAGIVLFLGGLIMLAAFLQYLALNTLVLKYLQWLDLSTRRVFAGGIA